MKRFWKSDTIYNETVLLYSVSGQAANGRLLFQPDKIISVKSFHLKTEYTNGKDYDLTGNVFTRINNSDIPYRADTSFSHKDLAWFNIQSQWIVVTYTHHDKRRGVKPEYKGDDMPNTFAKLELKTPLTIVAYGMSITRGMNVSGYDIKAPFMPSYVDMFARALREKYHGEIRMYNAGLPGSKIDWGAEYTFNINATDVYIDTTQLHNYWVMEKNESWMNRKVGEVNSMSASAIISRGIEKPVVTLKKGDTIQPYILASKYPNGAIAVAAIGRTINRDHINPRADVLLKVENLSKPLGIFGYFNKLTIQLEKPSTFRQIFAQDLAGDQPVDVTHKILVKGDKVVIPGKLIDQIGLMYATKGDKSEPGLVLSFKK